MQRGLLEAARVRWVNEVESLSSRSEAQAEVSHALDRMGVGWVSCLTVTTRPQQLSDHRKVSSQ